jgi:8-amino-7-oxononanoate synthase
VSGQEFLINALEKRKQENALRQLVQEKFIIDFCSNDYLGFTQNPFIKASIQEEINLNVQKKSGAAGSRLLAGNSNYAEELEAKIALFHSAESALIFNSGYDANLGLLSCIAKKEDTIIYDSLSHASIIDGVKLSAAGKKFKFKHNSTSDLQKKIESSSGNVFVVVESLYSMDGDFALLEKIEKLCALLNANLIVDEAHANGIIGKNGSGMVCNLGLEKRTFARIVTFGKSLGAHGACVLGSLALKNYLVNFSRSFIYTTALPIHSLIAINSSYHYLEKADEERNNLFSAIQFFIEIVKKLNMNISVNNSPIQSIIIPGNSKVKEVSMHLIENGFDVRPILSPTVPKGTERLRMCLHSYNTKNEIEAVLQLIKKMI